MLLIIIKIYGSNFSKWQHLWFNNPKHIDNLCVKSHADLNNATTTNDSMLFMHWPAFELSFNIQLIRFPLCLDRKSFMTNDY